MKSNSKKPKKKQFSNLKSLLKADREKDRAVRQAGQYAAFESAQVEEGLR